MRLHQNRTKNCGCLCECSPLPENHAIVWAPKVPDLLAIMSRRRAPYFVLRWKWQRHRFSMRKLGAMHCLRWNKDSLAICNAQEKHTHTQHRSHSYRTSLKFGGGLERGFCIWLAVFLVSPHCRAGHHPLNRSWVDSPQDCHQGITVQSPSLGQKRRKRSFRAFFGPNDEWRPSWHSTTLRDTFWPLFWTSCSRH